jgi:glycosyltransferase involved in cell wall biosynthesis
MKLSIIIPVYNVTNYVERCIRSLADQNLDPKDYEIIIINDGSTDNSLNICEKVSQDYQNINIFNQINTGLGGARNTGISEAKGEYIWFVDSDDFIAPNSLSEMVDTVIKNDTDVLAFDFNCTDVSGKKIDWIDFKFNFNQQEILTGPEFYSLNYNDSYIWLYLFKKDIFLDHNLLFEERINMQDSEILPRIMHNVKSVCFLDKEIYSYVNRNESFINSKKTSVRVKYFRSVITVHQLLLAFKNSLPFDSLIAQAIDNKLMTTYRILFFSFLFDPFDKDSLTKIISYSQQNNLFPFKYFECQSKKDQIIYNCLRILINKQPIVGRSLFLNVKASIRAILSKLRKIR